jgi:hypothetical protein
MQAIESDQWQTNERFPEIRWSRKSFDLLDHRSLK